MSTRPVNTLDWKCRHLRQSAPLPGKCLPEQSCAVGVDMSAVRLIARPCIQNPERPSEIMCDRREPMTEEDKAAWMAPFVKAMADLEGGRSPCCGAPVTVQETARSVVKFCSRCGALALHILKSNSEVPS